MDNFDYEPMDMPTPCEHCGKIFDLNDGRARIIQCVRQRFSEMKDIEPEFVDIVNEKFWDLF